MAFSPAEKKLHDSVYRKVVSESKEKLTQKTCLKLFQRGVPNFETCEKIWNACLSYPGQEELTKQELSKGLKYISALQNGYKFEEIVYDKLPELPAPSLPKRNPHENTRNESNDYKSQGMISEDSLSMKNSSTNETNKANNPPQLLGNMDHEESKELILTNGAKQKEPVTEETLVLSTVEDIKVAIRKEDNEFSSMKEVLKKHINEEDETDKTEIKPSASKEDDNNPSVSEEHLKFHPALKEEIKFENAVVDVKHSVSEEDIKGGSAFKEETTLGSIVEDVKPLVIEENTKSQAVFDEEVQLKPSVKDVKASVSEQEVKVQPAYKEEIKLSHKGEDAEPSMTEPNTKKQIVLKEDFCHKPAAEDPKIPTIEEEKQPLVVKAEDNYTPALKDSQISNSKMSNSEKDLSSISFKILQAKSSYHDYMISRQKIRIEIVGSKEVTSGILGISSYTLYTIHAKYEDAKEYVSDRRYSDFEWLDHFLRSQPRYKGLNIPILPEKKAFGNMNLTFVEKRKEGLEYYLKELGRHSVLNKDETLHKFFSTDSNGFEKIKESIPLPGIFPISAADIINFSKTYEYISATIKAQIKQDQDESILEDVDKAKSVHQRLQQLQNFVQEFIQSLESASKKGEVYTELSNGIKDIQQEAEEFTADEAILKLEEFCTIVSNYVSNKFFEVTRDENLLAGLKKLEDKIIGLENGHRIFIELVNDYKTNEELRSDKESKILRFLVEGRDTRKIDEEKGSMDKAIEQQRKEIKIAIENLETELNELETVFDLIINEEIDNYNSLQNNYWIKYYTALKSENPFERNTIDIIEF